MSIAAQLAQGSKLYIAGSAAAPISLVSATAGNPTILTFLNVDVATALLNGDSCTITGVTGADAALLNGVHTVSHKAIGVTNTTFTVEVDSTGSTGVTLDATSATATPAAWIQVKEVKAIKPSSATASSIDVTDLDSTAKEFRTGLVNNGTFSADINVLESDPGQIAVEVAFKASSVDVYKIETPAKTRTFSASCMKFPTVADSSVDGVQTGSMDFQISGDVAVA